VPDITKAGQYSRLWITSPAFSFQVSQHYLYLELRVHAQTMTKAAQSNLRSHGFTSTCLTAE